jgi:hypothetical protein
MRIEGIRFGQLPGGFGKVLDLAGIDDDKGQGGRHQCCNRRPVGVSCRGEHNQRGSYRVKLNDAGGNPWRIVRDRPAFARGPQAISRCALAPSIPTKHCGADCLLKECIGTKHFGVAKYRETADTLQ